MTDRTPEQIRAEWIARLRANTDKQGFGVLRSLDGCFCALGVLCDVVDPNGWDQNPQYGTKEFRGKYSFLPPEDVLIAAGLKRREDKILRAVGTWNDRDRLSFPEIADRIEALFAVESLGE
jgi:hypothetical protein